MATKQMKFHQAAQQKLKRGVDQIANRPTHSAIPSAIAGVLRRLSWTRQRL